MPFSVTAAPKKDLYELLGVGRDADNKELKTAYYKVTHIGLPRVNANVVQLAKQYHPDANPGDKQASEKFAEISEAYEVRL